MLRFLLILYGDDDDDLGYGTADQYDDDRYSTDMEAGRVGSKYGATDRYSSGQSDYLDLDDGGYDSETDVYQEFYDLLAL
jgi:hypothetical protein